MQEEQANTPFWCQSVDSVVELLQSDKNGGLSHEEAHKRLKEGERSLFNKRGSRRGWIRLLIAQFNTPLIYMLLLAALLSLLLYDSSDALIILTILVISLVLSFVQERKAAKATEKLLNLVAVRSDVMRDGQQCSVPIEEVVPGDLVEIRAGDMVPGDCLVFQAKDLHVDEAVLTGETFSTEKRPGTAAADASLHERRNVLFMGTHVVSGMGRALVISVAQDTEFGKIVQKIDVNAVETAFERSVRQFGGWLLELTLILLIIILCLNLYFSKPLVESLLFALALSVGLTPQLLPAIVSINLARGAAEIAKKGVIVKKLTSIENLGGMTILCTDKTGTLTCGTMRWVGAYAPSGQSSSQTKLYAYLNAHFQSGYSNPIDLAILAEKEEVGHWSKLDEIPYDFVRKRISILVKDQSASVMITKGAFKEVLSICSFIHNDDGSIAEMDALHERLSEEFSRWSNQGNRVLGIAYKSAQTPLIERNDEQNMVFLGFLVFADPIKEGVTQVMGALSEAGISIKVITGDNRLVATHVAHQVGLGKGGLLVGAELQHMSDEALLHRVGRTAVFAEIEPNQKERILLSLRKRGHIVGFLGDGINDITALHAADVSISVDQSVDAAKEVADFVLTKKDLSVLLEGVRAGRITFANTLKYVFMASSANFGNMFSMAGASLFLPFLPLLPKQVLLTNLLTDLPEMAIATDRVDEERIEKPVAWKMRTTRRFMLLFGALSSVFDYATFGVLLLYNVSVEEFRTAWFVESVLSATLVALVIRTFRPFWESRPGTSLLGMILVVGGCTLLLPTTPFAPMLGLTTLPPSLYLLIGLIVTMYLGSVECAKRLFFRKHAHANGHAPRPYPQTPS